MPRRSSPTSSRGLRGGTAAASLRQEQARAGAAAASMMPGAGAGGGQSIPSEEAAGAVVPPLPTPPAPAKGRVCIPCRMARVRCDLNVPCERCFRLCIQCKQSVRKPYTRRHAEAGEAAGDDEEGEEASAGDSSRSSDAKRKGGRKRGRNEAAAAVVAAEPPPLDATPITDLIIKRNDPRVAASLYLKGFERLLQDGRVIRDRVLAVLRIWRVWSLAAGVDVTWGLLGEFTRALGVNPVELEGREAVRWGLCAERRAQRAYRQLEGMDRVSKALHERSDFRQADDGITPMFMAFVGGPPPNGEEAVWGDDQEAVCFQACNAPLVAMLKSAAFNMYGAVQYKAIQTLNTLGFLAPADREQYLYRLQELLFTETRAISDIFKASFGDGNVRLYLFKARRIELDEDEERNGRVCIIHYIEPCPASRHVTDMPEALKTRVVKYHKPYQPGRMPALLPTSLRHEPPPGSSCSSSSSVGSTSSCGSSSGASSAPTHANALGGPAMHASGLPPVYIPAMVAVPAFTPAAEAAAGAAAATALDPAGLFGAGARDGWWAKEPAAGGALVKEEAKDDTHELSPLMAPALLAGDDAAAAAHQLARLHPHAPSPPPPSPTLVPTPAVAPALGAFLPTSTFEALSPPLSPSASASPASSLSEEAIMGDRGGAGGGGGGEQGLVDCGNGLRPPWLPAVPVFDEAGMESIFD